MDGDRTRISMPGKINDLLQEQVFQVHHSREISITFLMNTLGYKDLGVDVIIWVRFYTENVHAFILKGWKYKSSRDMRTAGVYEEEKFKPATSSCSRTFFKCGKLCLYWATESSFLSEVETFSPFFTHFYILLRIIPVSSTLYMNIWFHSTFTWIHTMFLYVCILYVCNFVETYNFSFLVKLTVLPSYPSLQWCSSKTKCLYQLQIYVILYFFQAVHFLKVCLFKNNKIPTPTMSFATVYKVS